jgi:hypothetical protein
MILDGFCFTESDFVAKNYLRGYVFTGNELILGTDGLNQYRQAESSNLWTKCKFGRYLLIETDEEDTLIRTDLLGQEPLYYYLDGNNWCVSNSLLLLAEKLKSKNIKLKPYFPAVDAFRMANQSLNGGQLTSFNTPILGAKILPLHLAFRIRKNQATEGYALDFVNIGETANNNDYQQTMYQYLNNWLGRTQAIAKLDKTVKLSLSGGFDSRACLSILKNETTSTDIRLLAGSHKHKLEEYAIATSLCDSLGFKLGRKNKEALSAAERLDDLKLFPTMSYRNSMLANAGVKTNFSFRERVVRDKSWHCVGGSAIGTFSMRNSFNKKKADLITKYSDSGIRIASEISDALCELGIDKDDELALFHHYYQFRSRFHYGMDLYTSQHSAQLHPLLDIDLVHAAIKAGKEYTRGNNINRDIISLMNPELLKIPFDGNRLATESTLIKSFSAKELNPTDYKIYGNFTSAYLSDYSLIQPETNESEFTIKQILSQYEDAIKEIANMFMLSDRFVDKALKEIRQGTKLKKAGVLLGLYELFK